MDARSLIRVLHTKPTILPVQSQPKLDALTSIASTGISRSRVFVGSRRNDGGVRVRSIGRLVCCASRVEVVKGESVNAKTESLVGGKRLAVFVSGGGSNFRSIYEASFDGYVNGEVVVLVTTKPECGGAKKYNVDYVLLAGYLKLIPAELIRAYPKSILNIHPSLLPAFGGKGFYGMKVHSAVIASGARYSGPTIHFVDENFDTGRILAQRVVPVLATDTAHDLADRVLHEEHKLYVEVTAALCEGRIVWREDGVPLIQSKENPNEYR
ncbi:hypothetical protein QQ045_028252 [Rhodiola kirilowii]